MRWKAADDDDDNKKSGRGIKLERYIGKANRNEKGASRRRGKYVYGIRKNGKDGTEIRKQNINRKAKKELETCKGKGKIKRNEQVKEEKYDEERERR